MQTIRPVFLTALGLLAASLLGACAGANDGAADAADADDAAASTDEVVAADAFCPQGFAFDTSSQLCLSATEAAGPFPPSMVALCRQWVPNRPDGSNACVTTLAGLPSTRWARNIAVNARAATRQADGCAQGTAVDAKQGYCSDGKDLYGPFSKDDVSYCQTVVGGGTACATNRVAVGMVRPKSAGPGPGGNPVASFAGSYDRAGAVAYAQANWNNNDGELCQGFVSNALAAGGINVRNFGVPNEDWVPDVYQFVWSAKGVPFDEHAPGSTTPLRACPGDVVVYSNAVGSNFCRTDLNGNDVIRNCGHTGVVVRGGNGVSNILANHHNGSNQNTALNRILDGTQVGVTARNYSTLRVYHLSNCEFY